MNHSRRGSAPEAARFDAGGSRPAPYSVLLAYAALAITAALTFHGALGYFFAQDDFEGLARARGLLPRLPGPWRLLSNQLYFDVMRAAFDLRPFAYHLASLLAHQLLAVLTFRYLRGWVGAPAAFAGAVFVAVHPALFTALYWISAGSTIHSAVFALFALLAERSHGMRRWLSVPCYALALCARETAIALPLVALVTQLHDRRARANDGVIWALAGVAVAFLAGMTLFDVIGFTEARGTGAAYSAGLGTHVFANLASYLAWSANFLIVTVRSFTDAVEPSATPIAIVTAAAAIGGALFPALRARGWIVAWTLFAAWIAPVLLLRHHTYHYYLEGPLIGIGWSFAILLDVAFAWLARRTSAHGGRVETQSARGVAVALAVALGVLLTWNGRALVHKIETYPFGELRADPTVDRAIIAGNVHASLAATPLPGGIRLRFWSPISIARQQEQAPGAENAPESYWERNVRTAILDGLGVRVLFPQVRSVVFVRELSAVPDSTWYAVYRPDGNLGLATYAMLDSMSRAHAESPR